MARQCRWFLLAGWMFRMRAYAGGRFVGLWRMAYLGTP